MRSQRAQQQPRHLVGQSVELAFLVWLEVAVVQVAGGSSSLAKQAPLYQAADRMKLTGSADRHPVGLLRRKRSGGC